MTNKEFELLVNERCKLIKAVLNSKGKEYGATDRLHNFKVASRIDAETPLQSAWGMFKKHLVSIIDIKDGLQLPTTDMINEKFGDAINYLILMEALIKEEIGK
jgi:hypothetical protein